MADEQYLILRSIVVTLVLALGIAMFFTMVITGNLVSDINKNHHEHRCANQTDHEEILDALGRPDRVPPEWLPDCPRREHDE